MNSITELIAAYQAGELALLDVFEALKARGPLSDAEQRNEIGQLERIAAEGGLNPQILRALRARLAKPQNPPVPAGAGGGDVVTVVQAPSRPGQTRATDTGVGTGNPTGTGGSASSRSLNTSSWQRVAAADAVEYATVGMLLKGRFLLEREIGHGGMGVVYKARDERKVEARDREPYLAVKVLNDEFRRHPDSLIALQRESKRSQKLAHPNIVQVFDFDKDGTIVFMTMEYIDGSDLRTLIRDHASEGMALREARPLIEGMARALERAHKAGVVHSDFKPSNVMVTKDGVPKVFDFGIARAGKVDDKAGEQTVFDAGTLGALTPAYASLEMLQGADPTPSDDIYAFGCVVYELLTGKHPFAKLNAEIACKEDRKPPQVPGLSRRQNQALADAVAFQSTHRTQKVMDVVEGLRDVGLGERARPWLIWGSAAALVLAAAAWGTHRYLGQRRVNAVIGRFAQTSRHRYTDENQALQALQALGAEQRDVVAGHAEVIAAYLRDRLAGYWDVAHKHYDYAGVEQVFAIRGQLKLYAPQLEARRLAIDQQRTALLNQLDTQLGTRAAAGALFDDQPDNVVETLAAIRAIAPQSALLDDADLKLKYEAAIDYSLDAGRLKEAKHRLVLTMQLFPQSKPLQQRKRQLADLEKARVEAGVAARHSVPQARDALADLLASPALAPAWRAAVAGNLKVLQGDSAPATKKLRVQLSTVVAGQAATATTPVAVAQAVKLVAMALTWVPESPALLAQRDRLAALQRQRQAQVAAAGAAAQVASLIESVKRAAAARDIDKASASLAGIRSLQPENPFLASAGPQLLAQAYIGRSRSLAEQGKVRLAADTLETGVKAVGNNQDLDAARSRMAFVADLLQARQKSVSAREIRALRSRWSHLDKTDSTAMDALQADLKQHGALPADSFAAVLGSLKVTAPKSGSTWAGVNAASNAEQSGQAPARSYSYPSAQASARAAAPSRSSISVRDYNAFCRATHQCTPRRGSGAVPSGAISRTLARAYESWSIRGDGYSSRSPSRQSTSRSSGNRTARPPASYGGCNPYTGSGGGYRYPGAAASREGCDSAQQRYGSGDGGYPSR